MRRSFLLIIAGVLAFAGGLGLQVYSADSSAIGAWDDLPALRLPDLEGKPRQLDEWRGKILVLNFWATWCPPCRKEIPEFVALQQQYGSQGLQFVGIAIDAVEPVAEYAKMSNINYPMLIAGDAGMALAGQWGNQVGAVPFTVVIAPDGQVLARHPGELSRAELLAIIQPVLEQGT
ncbi:MAG: TlpA disulfide reductase family protein [Methylococcales bacterium]|nr:TlpA disulfide reductase family protein [Methylococcales bacterium]